LIERLEDGNVALFAGAGVSKNIGLPLFDELVTQVYDHLNQSMRPEEEQEFENHNYDRTLGLFETRLGEDPRYGKPSRPS
jgi:NAD-dependent SIR2 family protein deacetylase